MDPEFKKRLLANGNAALKELDLKMGAKLIVVENTAEAHNLVACKLCSCYPFSIMGTPPNWYKSESYRTHAFKAPRAVLAKFGTKLPDSVKITTHDSTQATRYLVLPMRPSGTEGMTEAMLAKLVTRDSLIGVTVLKSPREVKRAGHERF